MIPDDYLVKLCPSSTIASHVSTVYTVYIYIYSIYIYVYIQYIQMCSVDISERTEALVNVL